LFARFFKFSLGVLLFAWLAALTVVAWLVHDGYAVALERGERGTAAFAAVVEQQTARTFQAVYLTLGAVGDTHNLQPRPRPHDGEFQEMMARRLKDLPFVRALFVVGPDGWILHDTDHPRTPNLPLADREYFVAHQHDPALASAAWPPLISRSGTGWFVPFTRPLNPSAGFEGVVVAAIQTDHFAAQFRQIGLADGYSIALFHLGGALVALYPARDAEVGKNFSHLPLFRHVAQRSGSFWSAETILPGERVVSYRVLENAPFVVQTSRTKSSVLAEWRRTATGTAIAMLTLTVLLGWFIAHLVRDRARRARERERRAQAEKMEALGQLTAGITHDFGNLLNIVALNVELMRQGASNPALVSEALGATERAVRGGMAMLDRLLSFARRQPLAVAPVRLGEWLDTARPLLEQAAGPLVTLLREAEPDLPEVMCDPAQLDAAVMNLVVNARDAMAGSGRITIRLYACDHDSGAPKAFVGSPPPFVCLAVQDEGSGMPERIRRRALEPFYTTKGEAGTGLGLSQVYGFMQQVGGDVTIDSAPGRGTTVHLFFKVAPHGAQP
jgi:signal transduction histidine kinase